ncbi:MlaE family ABC transporter permease [Nocardia pseudobrasiliensis]|uniref:Phospholipid/cholesterol/gamma-HCH transport system permease protein n=1 Tax=Nocardia pseudobrasiliensis TaxID=45979 RepID=A0A370IBS7_9NOCA|nr:ABC transporter permease [Nocardia pseudobrasiliensis]RDI68157.1 phospholipid/cholesterol/gamma-HCH transport system permease protein [Nocardia pseudobrasiliensis]
MQSRSVVRQFWDDHPRRSVDTLGRQLAMARELTVGVVLAILRGRFNWREFVRQCAFMSSVSAIPTMIVAVPIGVVVSLQVSMVIRQVGADSFVGAAVSIGVVKQGAPLVTSIMIAGAVGSAICADLGSRTIREEIDAMHTMAVDPLQRLVGPRLVAATLVSVMLCGFVVFVGFAATYGFFVYVQHGTAGSFLGAFVGFASSNDLLLALFKSALFGYFTAIIAGYHGLHARGGPAGVANAVNAAVVQSALVLLGANVLVSQIYNTVVPNQVM